MLRQYAKKALEAARSNDYRTLNRIELSEEALLYNIDLIAKQHPGQMVIPVLKGNAYGHGLVEMARMLNYAQCPFVAVDGYFEAAKIRDISSSYILVMGYILPENLHLVDTKRCSFVVQDIAGLTAFSKLGRPIRIHMELNTGFNRLGLQPEEIPSYLATLKKYPNLKLEGVMTHLVDADNDLSDRFTVRQQKMFDAEVKEIFDAGFKPTMIHIAQTAGSPKIKSKYANTIRLGIGTYGINPLGPKDPKARKLSALKPVLELKSTIIKVIDLETGDFVGYNATFKAAGPMRIGVLPLGYYEGLPRELSNLGCVTRGRKVLPIVGRVCMNHTMIDLSGSKLKVGDEVTVISRSPEHQNSITRLRTEHGLFPYTVLTGLSSSVRRVIV
jgi:alanine racemase